jgi:hypothetical protein
MGNQSSVESRGAGLTKGPTISRDEADALPIVPHSVYALMALDVYCEPDRRPLPPGWSILMESQEVKLDREGYYAIAYVNDRMRHCVIAERGTTDALGIRAGIWMYFDEPTIQFTLADQFTKLVKLRLQISRGVDPMDDHPYVLSFTGHSLGGVLAACQACREHTFAITFENPGCRKFVDLTMHPFTADDVDIITYLRQPNPINSLRPHCGYLVQLPYQPALPADHLRKGVAMQSESSGQPPITSPAHHVTSTIAAAAAAPSVSPPGSPVSMSPGSPSAPSTPVKAQVAVQVGNMAVAAEKRTGQPATAAVVVAPRATPRSIVAGNMTSAIQAARRMITLTTPHEFLRSKLLEASMPELQHYLTRVEPVIKELLDHTQQVHSIASIVDSMLAAEGGNIGQDVVLVWPSHLMQFLEFFNIQREMADPANQDANLYAAYQQLLSRLWQTESRPKHKLPLKFLNHDSQRLVCAFMFGGSGIAAERRRPASPSSPTSDTSDGGSTMTLRPASTPREPPTADGAGSTTSTQPVVRAFSPKVEVVALAESKVFALVSSLLTTGLSELDLRFLRSLSIQGENLVSSVLTAFEAKQYLALIVMRPRVRAALDRALYAAKAPAKVASSKL